MTTPGSRFTRPSTRWALHFCTLILGAAGIMSLVHFLLREVEPALDQLQPPQRWWSGILAFVLLAASGISSAAALASSVLARLGGSPSHDAEVRR